jgi:hypothetical protein
VPSWHNDFRFQRTHPPESVSTAVAATPLPPWQPTIASLLVAQLQLVDLDNRTRGKSATNMAIVSQ